MPATGSKAFSLGGYSAASARSAPSTTRECNAPRPAMQPRQTTGRQASRASTREAPRRQASRSMQLRARVRSAASRRSRNQAILLLSGSGEFRVHRCALHGGRHHGCRVAATHALHCTFARCRRRNGGANGSYELLESETILIRLRCCVAMARAGAFSDTFRGVLLLLRCRKFSPAGSHITHQNLKGDVND